MRLGKIAHQHTPTNTNPPKKGRRHIRAC
jgi:hypothetical protein